MARRTVQEIVSGNSPVSGPQKQGLNAAYNPAIGRQLSRRVASGAITAQQAKQTANQRALLKQKFGPNWRTKIYGDTGYVQRNRQQIAEGSTDPNVLALNKKLMALRANALKRATK